MDGYVARIERLENGWELEICDPDVQNKNRDPKNKSPWEDPWKGYAFEDKDKLVAFLSSKLDSLYPQDDDEEFDQAFKAASSDD